MKHVDDQTGSEGCGAAGSSRLDCGGSVSEESARTLVERRWVGPHSTGGRGWGALVGGATDHCGWRHIVLMGGATEIDGRGLGSLVGGAWERWWAGPRSIGGRGHRALVGGTTYLDGRGWGALVGGATELGGRGLRVRTRFSAACRWPRRSVSPPTSARCSCSSTRRAAA